MYRTAGVLLLATLLTSQLPAEQPTPEELIQRLADKDFKVRRAAAKAIEELGPEALPALRQAREHPDLEVRNRIARWIPEFETLALVAPKKVTLNLVNQPLSKAVAELAQQSGYKLELQQKARADKLPCTIQITNVPFWQALDKICREGGLVATPDFRLAGGLSLYFSDGGNPQVVYHQAFRVVATNLVYNKQSHVTRSIDLAQLRRKPGAPVPSKNEQTQSSESLHLSFALEAEPRLQILGVGEPSLTEALDEHQQSLLPKQNAAAQNMMMQMQKQQMIALRGRAFRAAAGMNGGQIALQVPSDGAHTLKVIRGSIPVHLEKGRTRTVVFEDLAKAQGKKVEVEGSTYQLDLFTKSTKREQYDLHFSVTGKQPGRWGGPGGEAGELELQDAQGHAYFPYSTSTSSDGRTYDVRMSFGRQFNNAGGQPGPPVKLALTKTVQQVYHVPFEFRDLPFP
jgi:hypothetical protein